MIKPDPSADSSKAFTVNRELCSLLFLLGELLF